MRRKVIDCDDQKGREPTQEEIRERIQAQENMRQIPQHVREFNERRALGKQFSEEYCD